MDVDQLDGYIMTDSVPSHWENRCFSIIEIIITLAIIGIIATATVPMIKKLTWNANRANGASNMRQITLAYVLLLSEKNISPATEAASIVSNAQPGQITDHIYAAILTKHRNDLSPKIFAWKSDKMVKTFVRTNKFPSTILSKQTGQMADNFSNLPLSVHFFEVDPDVFNRRMSPSLVPVVCSRGLAIEPDGTFKLDPETGVFGDTGAFLGFLDGHVEWCDTADLATLNRH
ncbi:MAG: hypothetical protein LBB20_02990 [Puniceicoccales bacterium]|jgi:type II secretory pathway pseudopilin PulG|nr:hypothetical protein [Puniceicoccales bacterium]